MKRIYLLTILLFFTLTIGAQNEKQLLVLHTSDTHSRIEPIRSAATDSSNDLGGIVRRATLVKQQRAKYPHLLLVDCGDISQGTPYYNMYKGELEVKMMNLMKYDAMALGNHEFDFGMENMARLFRLATFPVLSANCDVTGTVLEGLVKPYTVIEREGVRIGIFGLTPKLEGLVQEKNYVGIIYQDPFVRAQEVTDRLRGEEGCDMVICLSHLGVYKSDLQTSGDEALIARTVGIDLVLGGHTHTLMPAPKIYLNAAGENVSLLHSGNNGMSLGRVFITLNQK